MFVFIKVGMIMEIDGLKINYIQFGNEKGKDIVLLHGWGQNIEMMKPIGDRLCDDFRITILDFAGFENGDEPKDIRSKERYCVFLEDLLKKLKVRKPIVIGHSFGGRVAIKYSSRNPVEKLVLFGAPCIRKDNELSFSVKMLKKIKKIPGMNSFGEYMKKYIGSRDYKAASPIMRQTLVNVVNEDLSKFAREIECPTLLVWGENDEEAPISDAEDLEKIMMDAALIRLPGGHYAYLENIDVVTNILYNFFKS